MPGFTEASTWEHDSSAPGRFTTTIEDAWLQGKGAYGGLLAAGMLRAMEAILDGGTSRSLARKPRTQHVCFCAPARPGSLACDVSVERAGNSVVTLTARATQQDDLVCLSTATFAVPPTRLEQRARYLESSLPQVPQPLDIEPMPRDIETLPKFTRHFDYRFCAGAVPFSGAATSKIGAWVRLLEPAAFDAPLVAALIDATPPAVLARLAEPRSSASVNLTIDFLDTSPATPIAPDAFYLLISTSRFGDGGTTDESQELWSEQGALLATCRQLVTLL